MPSTTPRQQHFMGMVHAFQMGKLHTKDLPTGVQAKVKKAAKTITKKESGEFASKVEEQGDIDFSVLSFKEYIIAESAIVEAFSELTEEEVAGLVEKCSMEDEEEIKKGAFHRWLGKSESATITDADIAKGLASGDAHVRKMANFAKNMRK